MVAKGKAAKSATGASMSKYDVEVEARLKALESKLGEEDNHFNNMVHELRSEVSELQAQVSSLQFQEAQEGGSDVGGTVANLIHFLKVQFPKQFKYYND